MTATIEPTQGTTDTDSPVTDATAMPARIETGRPTGSGRRPAAPRLGDVVDLSPEQLDALGRELDALRVALEADLGATDVEYIRRIIRVQRTLEVTGRALLWLGFLPPAWIGGVAALSISKILDNMEIGHNVLHGQYDWTNDPSLHSRNFEWDNNCPAQQWQHTHNVVHHTYTNVIGWDRDIGYGVVRINPEKPWQPSDLGNPLYATLLALMFETGIAVHNLEPEKLFRGKDDRPVTRRRLREIGRKMGRQALKDYVLFPALSGPGFVPTLVGNATANVVRNVWAFLIIFCGHFPDGAAVFDRSTLDGETRGEWYARQILGSANISGGPLFHIMSGNLSHQIEHHLFPDIPSHRYQQVAPQVREICERYGLRYNTGRLGHQLATTARKILRYALP